MIKLEDELQDRTTLLSSVVAQCKQLQERLEHDSSAFAKMEERSSLLQVKVLDREEQLRQRQEEWRHKEDNYLGEIQNERHLRETSELDLTKAQMRLEILNCESKDLAELEKENEKLQDKVRRQTAYLKRKLEQERAARDRQAGLNKIPSSATKTPARIGTGSVRKAASSGLASRAPTRSTAPESDTDTLDWELEELLAD